MLQRLFYSSLKKYCQVALRFYFSKWQIHDAAKIPGGPVLFVANHQNAFLDAVLVACSTHRDIWFLARANVFNKPWARIILSWLQMSPVYRFRDGGYSTLKKNDEVIERCVDLLSKGKSILIFAEGNHNDQYFLRPLQKGFARIAIASEEKNNWQLGVKIVPVGLQYESHSKFRSRVLVSFGDPITVEKLKDVNKPQEVIDRILKRTEVSLKPLMLDIPPEEYTNKSNFLNTHRIIYNDLVEQLKEDQKLIEQVTYKVSELKTKKTSSPLFAKPFIFYQQLNHLLPRSIIQWIIKNKVSDPQFIASLQFSIGMVLVPVFYFLQTGLLYLATESLVISTLYFLSLPVSVLARR